VDDLIIEVLEDFVDQELAFTLCDITQETQKRHPGVFIQHSHVRKVVEHEFFQNLQKNGYKRGLIDVGAPVLPYLYFPEKQEDLIGKYKANVGPQDLAENKIGQPPAGAWNKAKPINRKFTMVFGQ
jgi:hypothetical protein